MLFFIQKKDNPISVLAYEDLSNLKIGILKGSLYFDPFDNDPRLDKEEVALDGQLPQMLFSERIDLMAGWELPMDYFIALEGFSGDFEKVTYRFSGSPSYMAMSKKASAVELIPELSAIIAEMVENNEIEEITRIYLKEIESENRK